jgi:hypothetical protein
MARVDVKETRTILRTFRREILRELRKDGNRLRRNVRAAAPKDSGNLRRKIKLRVGWDAQGPFARVTTTARNPRTRFRYGLALQQQRHYLQRGLQSTPRR